MIQHARGQHPSEVARAVLAVAERAVADPRTRLDAVAVLGGPAVDTGRDVGAWVPHELAKWARSVRFIREPGSVGERITPPWFTRATNAGDCDDVAAAVCAWGAVVGLAVGCLWIETGPGLAHVAAVVSADWTRDELALVVDPETGLGSIHDDPWRWGQVVTSRNKVMGSGRLQRFQARPSALTGSCDRLP